MKYTGDSKINVSLSPQIAKPLDARLIVDSTEELYSIPSEIAYEGMPVVHAGNGTIYVLTDKSKISEPQGWTASYETVEFRACSQSEYNDWLKNTRNNKSIDGSPNYIREGVFYYVYEDSLEDKYQYYVSYGQFSTLENSVKDKASKSTVASLVTTVNVLQEAINQYHEDKETFLTTDTNNPESNISKLLQNYYSKKDLNDNFVRKSDITGNADDSEYIFVSKVLYTSDLQSILELLKNTLKTNEDGSLNSLSVNEIKSGDTTFNVAKMQLNGDEIAFAKNLPNVQVIAEKDYKNLQEKNAGTYYLTYSEDESEYTGYMTREYFENNYYKWDKLSEIALRIEKYFENYGDKSTIDINTFTSELAKKEDKGTAYSKSESDSRYLPVGNYLTEHIDISGKADITQIPKKLSLLDLDIQYLTKHQSLEEYAKKGEIPDVSKFITTHLDISNLATKDLIPTDNNLLKNGNNYTTLKDVIDYLKDNKVISTNNLIDSDLPDKNQRDFNAYVKDTYVDKSKYNELKNSFEDLLAWAKTKGYLENEE